MPKATSKNAGATTAASSDDLDDPTYEAQIAPREISDRLSNWIWANIDNLPDEFNAIPLHHELIVAVLTKERIRILNHLRQHGPVHSMNELAEALGRDRSAVSRDITRMGDGFVRVVKKGRRKQISATDRPIIIY